jgi:hypothetical protein
MLPSLLLLLPQLLPPLVLPLAPLLPCYAPE